MLLDGSCYFIEPTEATEKRLAYQPVTLENLYWVQSHFFNSAANMTLLDEQVAIKEALLYKWAGGDTIVELSNIGLSRDPLGLARIARATGLNVIMGSGYYVGLSHPPELTAKTEEEITEEIVRDIMVGVGDTAVRAGIIGEIGCGQTGLKDNERKVLRASAAAQQRTGAALNIHPSFSEDLVLEIIKILGDAGADLSRTIISHMDGFSPFSLATRRKIADTGCYIAFDTFGAPVLPNISSSGLITTEASLLGRRSEVDRINEIKCLIDEGYLNHILISQDVCFKHHYVSYGGAGYAHILRNVVPWMRRGGISDEQIRTMMVENPKRVLSFAPVKE